MIIGLISLIGLIGLIRLICLNAYTPKKTETDWVQPIQSPSLFGYLGLEYNLLILARIGDCPVAAWLAI